MSEPIDKGVSAAVWDARYREAATQAPLPATVLAEYGHLLPASGTALDLACGRGGNALWLAAQGLDTAAWDYSAVAIDDLRRQAAAQHLTIDAQVRDVVAAPPAPASFDVIVVTHFLERALFPALCAALRPGGLLFYQTFSRDAVGPGGPRNPAFRLDTNELLALTASLRVLAYREEGRVGDVARGWRDQALLVAQRDG